MGNKKVTILLIFLSWLFFFPARIRSEDFSKKQNLKLPQEIFPLKIGEEFVYTINWGIIPAGLATLKVDSLEKCGGVDCYKVRTSTRTNSFFDRIYKVRDTVESLLETSLKRSRYYHKEQREGRFRRNDQLIFDYQKEEAHLKRDGKIKNVIKIQRNENLLDPFGVLYYIRSLDLHLGDTIEVRVTDGKAIYLMQVNVIKRERVKAWIGSFDCLKIEPKMQNLEGIFHKKGEAKLYVWVSDDKHKIPVKVQSEVFIGSFQGLLKEIRRP